MMKKYQVKIDEEVFEFSVQDLENLDVSTNNNLHHILENNKSYKAKILNSENKKAIVEINGNTYNCTINNDLDILIDKLGLAATNKTISKNIIAPMPGLVLDILKSEGEEIEEGETILILEAMKMENALKSNTNGKITKINTTKGETVDKGFVIIEIE